MTTSTQWQLARDAAVRYEEILVPAILGPAARALVDRAAPRPGEVVVDVGCGTGAATRAAAERAGPTGRVVGVDVNPGMIEVARALPPVAGADITWHVAPADALPLGDGTADIVLCAQMLQFVTDRRAALAEVRRVLNPGGRVAISVWCAIHDNPYFDALAAAVARHIGPETAGGLGAAFGMSDGAVIRALLADAGFGAVDVVSATLDLPLPPLAEFVPRHVGATPMAAGFAAAGSSARQAVVRDIAAQLARHVTDTGVRVPFRTHLATASR